MHRPFVVRRSLFVSSLFRSEKLHRSLRRDPGPRPGPPAIEMGTETCLFVCNTDICFLSWFAEAS